MDQLLIELRAGGVSLEHQQECEEILGPKGPLDMLDFLTYLPLFILMHDSVVGNPLDMTMDKWSSSPTLLWSSVIRARKNMRKSSDQRTTEHGGTSFSHFHYNESEIDNCFDMTLAFQWLTSLIWQLGLKNINMMLGLCQMVHVNATANEIVLFNSDSQTHSTKMAMGLPPSRSCGNLSSHRRSWYSFKTSIQVNRLCSSFTFEWDSFIYKQIAERRTNK